MILIVLWNGHLAVERASWWNGHLGGMGILVEWASCPFHFRAGRMTTPLIFIPPLSNAKNRGALAGC
ncbi:hypothetical protein [Moorena sp. SIO3A2]|uniref:hypothetical protein n=1 Tax=Moorena sp. SIO3A2 TaxID=2607841 RepID=UPI0013BE6DD7|nr:hypothetical protein [Moorena sp. SIO3A2]NER87876.1 hypothetical protein [Moorena sp. SIO3A2]